MLQVKTSAGLVFPRMGDRARSPVNLAAGPYQPLADGRALHAARTKGLPPSGSEDTFKHSATALESAL